MIAGMAEPRGQKRGRRIAMSEAELDAFLGEERTCRVATVSAQGPHVSPLWFVWVEGSLWLHSLSRSQRWTDVERDSRVAVVVDAGEEYVELRGAEIRGRAEVVGEVPRVGEPEPRLEAVEKAFADKYMGGADFVSDGKHAWLALRPEKIVSWDFRKLYG
jgi:nitroimidazol reductase NimA-like FMN-containing flavoprotein (pyridoxamine 5'-phosphate oxidase superfamily)